MKIKYSIPLVALLLILIYNCNGFRSIRCNSFYSYKITQHYYDHKSELKVAIYNEIVSNKQQLPSTSSGVKLQYEQDNNCCNSISSNEELLTSLNLPVLSEIDIEMLNNGNSIQKQKRDGRSGTGWTVVTVEDSSPDVIFSKLANFMSYVEMIPTVRSVNIYNEDKSLEQYKVEYSLSKFKLKASVVQCVDYNHRIIKFSLDSDRPNFVFKRADGFWFVEQLHDDDDNNNNSSNNDTVSGKRKRRSRVWLSASIQTSRLVPTMIVDYAACRALPRATNWIQPYFAQLPN